MQGPGITEGSPESSRRCLISPLAGQRELQACTEQLECEFLEALASWPQQAARASWGGTLVGAVEAIALPDLTEEPSKGLSPLLTEVQHHGQRHLVATGNAAADLLTPLPAVTRAINRASGKQ